jgi:hypothetical protein
MEEQSDKSFIVLQKAMDAEYNSKTSGTLRIYAPSVGLPVAVLFSEDSMWYRCQIIKIHENSLKLDVHYVDYGNVGTVNLRDIRYLKKEFLINEIMVCT